MVKSKFYVSDCVTAKFSTATEKQVNKAIGDWIGKVGDSDKSEQENQQA